MKYKSDSKRWPLAFLRSADTMYYITLEPDKTNSIYVSSGRDWAVARIQRLGDTKYSVTSIGSEGLIPVNNAKRYVKRILETEKTFLDR